MRALCKRIEYRSLVFGRTDAQATLHLMLAVEIDGAEAWVDLGKAMRVHLGQLKPNRRRAIIQAMPPVVEVEHFRNLKGQTVYIVAQSDLQYWVEQARATLEREAAQMATRTSQPAVEVQ